MYTRRHTHIRTRVCNLYINLEKYTYILFMNTATQIECRHPLFVTFRMSPPRLRQEELEVSLSYTHQVQGQPRLYNKNLPPETKRTEGKEKLAVCCMDGRVQQASAQFPLWRQEDANGSPVAFPAAAQMTVQCPLLHSSSECSVFCLGSPFWLSLRWDRKVLAWPRRTDERGSVVALSKHKVAAHSLCDLYGNTAQHVLRVLSDSWGRGKPVAQQQLASFWPDQWRASPDGSTCLEAEGQPSPLPLRAHQTISLTSWKPISPRDVVPVSALLAIRSEEAVLMPRTTTPCQTHSLGSLQHPHQISGARAGGGVVSTYIRHWLQVLSTLGQGMETNVMERGNQKVCHQMWH